MKFIGVTVLCALSLLLTARAAQARYHITISGSVSDLPVYRDAALGLHKGAYTSVTNNGRNRWEACLTSGTPTLGGAGAIWFGSNAACNPSQTGTYLDLTYVTVRRRWSGLKITVRPDPNMSWGQTNLFTSTDSIFAIPFYVVGGKAVYKFSPNGKRVHGWFDLQGFSGSYQSEYYADISGRWDPSY